MAHTPSPWAIKKAPKLVDGAQDHAIVDQRDEIIAECFGRSGVTIFHDSQANARLIAAAPDLLAALKGVKGNCFCEFGIGNPMYRDHTEACKTAEAALAKAEGH